MMSNKELAAQCLIEAANILGDINTNNTEEILEEMGLTEGLLTAGAALAIGGTTVAASIYTIINGIKKEKKRKLDEQIKKQKDKEHKEYLKRQKLTDLSLVSDYTLNTTKKLINSAEDITCKKDLIKVANKIVILNNKISKYICDLNKTKINKLSDNEYKQMLIKYIDEINKYQQDVYDVSDNIDKEWVNTNKNEINKVIDDVFKSTLSINDMMHLEEIFDDDIDLEKTEYDLTLGIRIILSNIKIKGWK